MKNPGHVTLMREDWRRKPAITVYCVKCDWTHKTNDRAVGYKAGNTHEGKTS